MRDVPDLLPAWAGPACQWAPKKYRPLHPHIDPTFYRHRNYALYIRANILQCLRSFTSYGFQARINHMSSIVTASETDKESVVHNEKVGLNYDSKIESLAELAAVGVVIQNA